MSYISLPNSFLIVENQSEEKIKGIQSKSEEKVIGMNVTSYIIRG